MNSPPPPETPHIRLAPSNLLLHPSDTTTLPATPLPVYRQSPPDWALLGLYRLLPTDVASLSADTIILDGAWGSAALEKVVGRDHFTAWERSEAEHERAWRDDGGPSQSSSVASIPSVYLNGTAAPAEPQRIPAPRPTEPQRIQTLTPAIIPAPDATGSYADVSSMSESQYSTISGNESDSDGDRDSDRWSVLSTGPVDRQWTVVFEEKEEVV